MDIFSQFLNQISETSLPIIDTAISLDCYMSIDISESNTTALDFNVADSGDWEKYINLYLSEQDNQVAYGGYLEKRNLYDRSAYFRNIADQNKRNIHLGVDLWCTAGTKILAILKGEVHSFKDNNNYGDYGPTIIIKHSIAAETFYTLYGHLSTDSIKDVQIGTVIAQGEVIGNVGSTAVNGDYAPHLHFQIIRNLARNFGDYPGVASENDISFYINNCPDPNLLLKLDLKTYPSF